MEQFMRLQHGLSNAEILVPAELVGPVWELTSDMQDGRNKLKAGTTLVMLSGGGMVPVTETPEEVMKRKYECLNKKEI